MMSHTNAVLPLSHPVRVETIKLRPSSVVVRAQQAQLAAIATMLDLPSAETIEGHFTLSRNGERVKVEGRIKAALHQNCIVTLEPFPVTLDVPMKLDFEPLAEEQPERRSAKADDGKIDIEVRLNEDDPPEPIVDGVIDLGAVTLEFLALALDPYPRKPGVSFDAAVAGPDLESPFAALARLKPSE